MTGFFLVAIVVVVAPGPDFALTLRNTVARGRRAGVRTAAGVVSGQLAWEVATVAGIAALLVASRPAFVALRLTGAAYLVWLGLAALHAALRDRAPDAHHTRGRSAYRQGLLSNLGNPKMAVFFTSLLPQFGTSPLELAAHALVFSILTLGWLCVVACAGAALRVPTVRRLIDAVTGIVLVAFGARLAAGRR